MAWLDDVVASLQGGAAPLSMAPANPFPDPPKVAETDPAKIWASIEAQQQAENDAAARRNAAGLVQNFGGGQTAPYAPFGVPDVNSAGVQLAMDQAPAGTGVPVAPGTQISAGPSVPPSMQLASQIAAPPQQLRGPPAPPAVPPGAPTDLSSRNAAPAGGPTAGVPAAVRAAAAPPAAPGGAPTALPPVANPSFMDRIKAAAPDFTALGAAWGAGDWGPMRRQQEQDRALQLQGIQNNATARLLQSRGATVPEIQAAIAGGPDTIKSLLSEYLGKDKWKVVKTGHDARGNETYMQQNEVSGEVRPIPGAAARGVDNATDAAAAAGKTGDDFISAIPDAQDRTIVKQLINYDLDPGKLSAKNGNRERLVALAGQADPDYRPSLYAPRAAAVKEFTSGGPNSPASIITNGNTAIQHLGRMSELAEKLGGTNNAWIANGLVNWANVKLEDLKNNPDLAQYKAAEDRFVEEATKFYRGVGGNKSDIDRALSIMTPGQSPESRRAAILEQAELMQSKINSLQDRYKNAIGPAGWKRAMSEAGGEFPIVQQHSAEEMDKIRKRASGIAESPAKSGGAVKPGAYVWDPKRGLVPK